MGCCTSRHLRPSRPVSQSFSAQNDRPPEPPAIPVSTTASHSLDGGPLRTHRNPPPLNERFNRPIERFVKPWRSSRLRTKCEIDRDRCEFWDTRVTGREEIWGALRLVVEMIEIDIDTAQEILNASGITVPTGDLTKGIYDEQGNVYLIPKFCLSYPVNMIEENEENSYKKNSNRSFEDAAMAVPGTCRLLSSLDSGKGGPFAAEAEYILTARLSNRGGHDIQINFNSKDTVRDISVRIAQKENIQLNSTKFYMVFLGKILQDNKTLFAQGWEEGYVVNVMVRPLSRQGL